MTAEIGLRTALETIANMTSEEFGIFRNTSEMQSMEPQVRDMFISIHNLSKAWILAPRHFIDMVMHVEESENVQDCIVAITEFISDNCDSEASTVIVDFIEAYNRGDELKIVELLTDICNSSIKHYKEMWPLK